MNASLRRNIWLASGVRTPFARVDGALSGFDAIELSVPVVRTMLTMLKGENPDFAVWGSVVPNLTWSNIAREVLVDADAAATIPAFSTTMACSTSMIGAIEAAGMLDEKAGRDLALVGGVESMSRIQLGLPMTLSEWVKKFTHARSVGQKLSQLSELKLSDVRLYIPSVTNRTSGMSMGEHTEVTVKEWRIGREEQDELALRGHRLAVAAWASGFYDDLVIPVSDTRRDLIPRSDTSLEKLSRLPPAFDKTSGAGTLTAGNSSPLTDGAAALWVSTTDGLRRLPSSAPRVRLIDFEIAAVDFRTEGLLMAPAFALPRLLARHGLAYEHIDLWEIHEAFAGQVLFHLKAMEDETFLREKAGIAGPLGKIPIDAINPNGGSVALGHPFGATGARILSQAVKELASMPMGRYAVVSICADGGQGSVALLRSE